MHEFWSRLLAAFNAKARMRHRPIESFHFINLHRNGQETDSLRLLLLKFQDPHPLPKRMSQLIQRRNVSACQFLGMTSFETDLVDSWTVQHSIETRKSKFQFFRVLPSHNPTSLCLLRISKFISLHTHAMLHQTLRAEKIKWSQLDLFETSAACFMRTWRSCARVFDTPRVRLVSFARNWQLSPWNVKASTGWNNFSNVVQQPTAGCWRLLNCMRRSFRVNSVPTSETSWWSSHSTWIKK